MPARTRSGNDCPRCGAELRRVHRRSHEAHTLSGSGLRRYRCGSEGCGWQGLLTRQNTRSLSRLQHTRSLSRLTDRPVGERWRAWAVVAVVVVVLGLVSASLALLALQPETGHHEGEPVKSL